MNYISMVNVVAGCLQFIVAVYALRLARVYGATKVGWSLCCAFSLLALVHVLQFLMPSMEEGIASVPMIEVMYALVSMLLLMGMVHMESLLKERLRIAQQEKELRAELESEVKKKTAYLTRAIEELQSEIDRRTAVEARMEQSSTELQFVTQQVKAAEGVKHLRHNLVTMLQSVNAAARLVSDQAKQSSERITLTLELDTIKRNIEEIMALQPDHTAQGTWHVGHTSTKASPVAETTMA